MIEYWTCPKCGGGRFIPIDGIYPQFRWDGTGFVIREPDEGWEWFEGKLLCTRCLVAAVSIKEESP